MATSGTISGTMTALQLCEAAAKDLGIYGAGEDLSAADGADMLLRLNWMLKSWQADGVNLWREENGEVAFPINTATMELDPRCIDVLEARFVQSATFERPLQRWEIGQYQNLPNKTQPGYPVGYYLRKLVDSVTMTLWPVPDADSVVRYTYARVIEDVTDLNQTLDVPQMWMETIWTNLAVRCASMFGASRLDANGVVLLQQRAAMLEQKMMDQDRPASVFMGPNYARYF